jgi:hypothetical protein
MILDIFVILMFLALILLVIKLFKNSGFKANKEIPITRISEDEAKALEDLVLQTAIQDSSIKLHDQERIILKLDGIQLLEFKNINNKGIYQGISLRVMDGLSYRIGEFSRKQKQVLTSIDFGELIFTSNRVIFLGAKESLELYLKKLLSVNIAGKMLEIDQTGRSKVIFFDGLNTAWKKYVTSSGMKHFQAESGVLRASFIIKELIK